MQVSGSLQAVYTPVYSKKSMITLQLNDAELYMFHQLQPTCAQMYSEPKTTGIALDMMRHLRHGSHCAGRS